MLNDTMIRFLEVFGLSLETFWHFRKFLSGIRSGDAGVNELKRGVLGFCDETNKLGLKEEVSEHTRKGDDQTRRCCHQGLGNVSSKL